MELRFVEKYLSIEEFQQMELENFSILTGTNGAGKSHLLQAIEKGKVQIAGLERSNIVHFNYETFKLENEGVATAEQINGEKDQAWRFLVDKGKIIVDKTKQWRDKVGEDYAKILETAQQNSKPLWELTHSELGGNLHNKLSDYRRQMEALFREEAHFKNNNQAQSVFILIKRLSCGIDEIDQRTFYNEYKPYHFKQDFLPQQLGKVIWDYFVKYRKNEVNEFQSKTNNKGYSYLTEQEFIDIYGQKPWVLLNQILDRFNNLDYKIKSPEGLEQHENYQIELVHTSKPDVCPNFSELSSGERVLMALVASVYKSSSDKQFPDVLLLDEIDASLHPSMIRSLLEVIDEIFVGRGVKVILATHSPSTVALAPDNSIYLMKKYGNDRVSKCSKEKALQVLTEGFASLSLEESDMSISYKLSNTEKPVILTEGVTDKIILETAWKKLKGEEMPFYVQDCFDASFLGNLLRRGDEDGIFANYPDKIFMALFDFDEQGYQNWNNQNKFNTHYMADIQKGLSKKHDHRKAYVILLPVPNNGVENQVIAPSEESFKDKSALSIELMFYGTEELSQYFVKEPVSGGGEIINFCGKKVEFAEKIRELPEDSFQQFAPLFDQIEKIIKN